MAPRVSARTAAALTALALAAAVAAPVAFTSGEDPRRPVRDAAAGTRYTARTDQIRAREWHLGVLRATRAWKWSRGSGVTVAVLDTGVDRRHPDLTGRVLDGPDLTGGARRPGGRYWGVHGTSMASIIAGHGHGPGLSEGMVGVAPQARVLSVRVTLENDDPLRRGGHAVGDPNAIAQGIRYAVDHGADIINMSLGGGHLNYNGTPSQEAAIKYALGRGVTLIASAGNDGAGANSKNFPAAYPGVIAVGALDRRLRLWKDSNRRSRAAVCAPGVDIVSADSSGGYVVGTGTSASSAMVAGVAALVRARYPRLTPDQVRQALVQGSPPRRGHPTGSATCAGTVDAVRTLLAASRLNRASRDPVRSAKPPTPAAEPSAASEDEGGDLLLPGALGGGGLLLVLALVLVWWLRRRRPDAGEPVDIVPEYGLPPLSTHVPAGTEWAAGPADLGEPVGQPLGAPVPHWDGDDAYAEPMSPYPPMAPMPDEADEMPPEAPRVVSELRPFVPEEYPLNGRSRVNGTNGFNGFNGHNGHNGHNGGGLNGHGLNGHGVAPNGKHHGPPSRDEAAPRDGYDASPPGDDPGVLDDDDWQRFQRSALGDFGRPDGGAPPVPPPPPPVTPSEAQEPPLDPHDPLDPRNPLDPRDLLEPRDLGEIGGPRAPGPVRAPEGPHDSGGPRDPDGPRDPGGPRETDGFRDPGGPRDSGGFRDTGGPRDAGGRDALGPRDSRPPSAPPADDEDYRPPWW